MIFLSATTLSKEKEWFLKEWFLSIIEFSRQMITCLRMRFTLLFIQNVEGTAVQKSVDGTIIHATVSGKMVTRVYALRANEKLSSYNVVTPRRKKETCADICWYFVFHGTNDAIDLLYSYVLLGRGELVWSLSELSWFLRQNDLLSWADLGQSDLLSRANLS